MLSKREVQLIHIVLNSKYFYEIIDKMIEEFGLSEDSKKYEKTFIEIEGLNEEEAEEEAKKFAGDVLRDKTYTYFRKLVHMIRKKKQRMMEDLELIKEFEKKLEELGYGIRW